MADQTPTVDEMGAAALATMFGDYDGTIIDSDAGASAGDTSAAPVETQPRGTDGKFIKKEEEIVPEPEGFVEVADSVDEPIPTDAGIDEETEEESAGEAPDSPDSDEIVLDADTLGLNDDHILFTKYGGDLSKALEALSEAQSTIGRQGTELGELRELKEQLDSLQNLMTLQQQAQSVDWDEIIAEDPQQAVMLAVQYQNPQAFDEALKTWATDDPIGAFTFLQEIQQQATAPPPTTLESEMESLKARHPDIQQRLPAIQAEAEKRPALARLLSDEDPRVRAQALEDLYVLSRSQETPDTSKAGRRIILQARAEADAAKADAAVVSATRSAPPPAPPKSADESLAETLQQYVGLGDDFKIVG